LPQLFNKIVQGRAARKIAPHAFVVFSADAQAANIFPGGIVGIAVFALWLVAAELFFAQALPKRSMRPHNLLAWFPKRVWRDG
jgi:hypothetical protein